METTSLQDTLNNLLIELDRSLQENSGVVEIQVDKEDLTRIVEAISNDTLWSCEIISDTKVEGKVTIKISHPDVKKIEIRGG